MSKNDVITKDESQEQKDNTAKDSDIPVSDYSFGQTISHSNEITESFANLLHLYIKLALQTIDALRENGRLCGRTLDIIAQHNVNLMNSWLSFWIL